MREPLDVGAVIEGRYELVEELGQGGFAKVFAARQVHLDRLVAIKVLNVSLDAQEDDSFEKRFLHEAKMAAQISHPNVVTIHEFGFSGPLKQPYIAMEMLEGHDLDHELYDGPMLPSRALRLLMPALDALAAGHGKQIVHKDLKPANLFVTNPGLSSELLVVLDYGVARWNLDSSPKFTATGAFTGTPAYMAPEYARQQIVTPAVDVYQIGLILPEMLTGLPLVMEETPWDCLMIHTEGKVEIPEIVRTSPIGPIIEQALAYDHRERLPDASALRMMLEEVDPEELDEHFRERGLGTVEAVTMDATIPPEEFHRLKSSGTNAVWPPRQKIEEPDDVADTEPDPPRPRASPGTVAVPMAEGARESKHEKPSQPEPEPTRFVEAQPRAPKKWLGIAAAIVGVLFVATAAGLFLLRPDASPPVDPKEGQPEAPLHSVKVNSDPDRAVVALDGVRKGTTPVAVEWTGEKTATLTVALEGYEPQTLEVVAGETLEVTLQPSPSEMDETKRHPKKERAEPKAKPRPKPKPNPKPKPKRSGANATKEKKPGGFQIAN
jgi:serine/threonine-protein kinase